MGIWEDGDSKSRKAVVRKYAARKEGVPSVCALMLGHRSMVLVAEMKLDFVSV